MKGSQQGNQEDVFVSEVRVLSPGPYVSGFTRHSNASRFFAVKDWYSSGTSSSG
jgi:hypothetical protein